MDTPHFRGLIAAPFTPFTPDGGLNHHAIEVQARSLVDHGCIGAFVCGTTGEGSSLTIGERMQVAS
ncbi:dihydrodipicolinate synthase family protein, partial [Halomonas sp. SIMBA_159]